MLYKPCTYFTQVMVLFECQVYNSTICHQSYKSWTALCFFWCWTCNSVHCGFYKMKLGCKRYSWFILLKRFHMWVTIFSSNFAWLMLLIIDVLLLSSLKLLVQFSFLVHCSQDGHPPLGWHDTLAYLALPVLLVISQYISVQIMQASQVGHFPGVNLSDYLLTKYLTESYHILEWFIVLCFILDVYSLSSWIPNTGVIFGPLGTWLNYFKKPVI